MEESAQKLLYSLHNTGDKLIEEGRLRECVLQIGKREYDRKFVTCVLKLSMGRMKQYLVLTINKEAFQDLDIISRLVSLQGGTRKSGPEGTLGIRHLIAVVMFIFIAMSFSNWGFDQSDMYQVNEQYRAVADELYTYASGEGALRIGNLPITDVVPRFTNADLTIAAYGQPKSGFNNLTKLTQSISMGTQYRESLGFDWNRDRSNNFKVNLHNVTHMAHLGKSVAGYDVLDKIYDQAIKEQLTLMSSSGVMREYERQGIGIILNTKLGSNPGGFHYDYHAVEHTIVSNNGTIYQVHPTRDDEEELVGNTIIAMTYAKDEDTAVFAPHSLAGSSQSVHRNDPRVFEHQHLVPNAGSLIARQGKDKGWVHAGPGTLAERHAVIMVIESANPVGEKLGILQQPGAESRSQRSKKSSSKSGGKIKKKRFTRKKRKVWRKL